MSYIPVQVAIGEQSSATCNGGPTTLPAALFEILERSAMYVVLVDAGADFVVAAPYRPLHDCIECSRKGVASNWKPGEIS